MGRWTIFPAMLAALWAPAALAAITVIFYPAGGGGTMAHIAGSGVKMSFGSGDNLNWDNLNGGDPFADSLQAAEFALATPIAFTGVADIIGFRFDSDGTGVDQDDFTIRFSDLFGYEDPYLINGASLVQGLDSALLNPGIYTRADQSVGGITVIISGSPPVDSDGDGLVDAADNCSATPNPDQRDTDGDGHGNYCDGDFNQDCVVNPVDLGAFRAVFFSNNADGDLNGDGVVNSIDLGIFRNLFFGTPGPSPVGSLCNP